MATTITLTAKPRKNVVPNVPARIAAPPKTDMTKATPWLGKKCSTAADSAASKMMARKAAPNPVLRALRSEEHTSELQSLMRISYAVFCLKKKQKHKKYANDATYIGKRTH